jgi:hypothetical protein
MKKTIVPIVAIAVLACAGWMAKPYLSQKTDPKVAKFNEDAESLIIGLQQYKEFTGSYPTGTPAEISKALTGQSDKKVLILVTRKSELNTKGEIVDPWGTPVQVYFNQNTILIRSAGPNRVAEDSKNPRADDLYRSS